MGFRRCLHLGQRMQDFWSSSSMRKRGLHSKLMQKLLSGFASGACFVCKTQVLLVIRGYMRRKLSLRHVEDVAVAGHQHSVLNTFAYE